MPFRYKVLPEHRLLFGVFHGTLTPDEYLNGIEELSRNQAFEPDYDRLGILHDDLDLSLFGLKELHAIRDRMSTAYYGNHRPDHTEKRSYRIALVSKPSINETMLKLYAATLASSLVPTVSMKIFPKLDKALGWLERDELAAQFAEPDWVAFMAFDARSG